MQMRKEWLDWAPQGNNNHWHDFPPNITVTSRSDLLGLFLKITFLQHKPTTSRDRDYRVHHVFDGPVNIVNYLGQRFIVDNL